MRLWDVSALIRTWYIYGRVIDIPQWTGARDVHQPWIDTFRVELMGTRQHTEILALDKVVGTDRT